MERRLLTSATRLWSRRFYLLMLLAMIATVIAQIVYAHPVPDTRPAPDPTLITTPSTTPPVIYQEDPAP